MLDIFSDHVNISIKKVNISEFSKVPQSIDVRIASPPLTPPTVSLYNHYVYIQS